MTARYEVELQCFSRQSYATIRRFTTRRRVVAYASGRTAQQAIAQAMADVRTARKAKRL